MSTSEFRLSDGKVLSAETEAIDVTVGGLLPGSPPPSPFRTYAPGMTSYRLDGLPITREEAEEIIRQEYERRNAKST